MSRILSTAAVLAVLSAGPLDAATVTIPGELNLVPLDVSTVAVGGTAVTALTGGHRAAGGWLFNPLNATTSLCISEMGPAAGIVSAGATTCIAPGASYSLAPSQRTVSVVASDSNHSFSGMGFTN